MEFLKNVLGSATELSPWGFALRTLLVGVLLWAEGKILPYRAGGQYAGYDFAFFWMMGGITAAPLFEPKISFVNTIVIIIIIYLMHYLISYLMVKNRTLARIIIGKSIPLVMGGKIHRVNMARAFFPLGLLFSELRAGDASNVGEVETAVLETSGHVSIVKKAEAQPVTPKDLKLPSTPGGLPVIVIHDGYIQTDNLRKIGHDRQWLEQELLKYGVTNLQKVYLAQIDPAGGFYYTVK
jgi:uncharacterized membrane protein YcaP (DUF421 family)